MGSLAVATRRTYVDRESLNHALTSDLVGWTVSETREAPLLTHVVSHRLGDIRLVELSANPFGAVRGRAEISGDSVIYLGILYQRFGSTLCRRGDDRVIVARRTDHDPKFDRDGDNCDPPALSETHGLGTGECDQCFPASSLRRKLDPAPPISLLFENSSEGRHGCLSLELKIRWPCCFWKSALVPFLCPPPCAVVANDGIAYIACAFTTRVISSLYGKSGKRR
jgi:hypothetical protein